MALAIVVVGFAVGCFWVLAPWQLGKNSRTDARNAQIRTALSESTIPITDLGSDPMTSRNDWREVSLQGRFLPDKQVVVRLRSVSDSPAFEVLTPFRTAQATYLINRGYVRPDVGTRLPVIAAAPTDPMTVRARIQSAEGTAPGRGPRVDSGVLQVYTIDPVAVSAAADVPLAPGYLQMSTGQVGSLGEIPVPQLDSGPYLSYGLQWLAFGVMAPLGLGYFVVAEVRQRRAAAAAQADPGAAHPARAMPRPGGRAAKQARASLTAASTGSARESRVSGTVGSGSGAVGIGDDSVRAKLANRYGD